MLLKNSTMGWVLGVVAVGISLTGCGSEGTDVANHVSPPPSAAPGSPPAGTSERTEPLETGVWGGSNLSLNVEESSAILRFSEACTTGKIDQAVLIDEQGRFSVPGTLTSHASDGSTDPVTNSAIFSGQLSEDGSSLKLSVTTSSPSGSTAETTDLLSYGFEGPVPGICQPN